MMLIKATASHQLPFINLYGLCTMLNENSTQAVQFVVIDQEYEI